METDRVIKASLRYTWDGVQNNSFQFPACECIDTSGRRTQHGRAQLLTQAYEIIDTRPAEQVESKPVTYGELNLT